MSRDGSEGRIDSLKNTLTTEHYNRTALGSAVRFNAMLNLITDFADGDPNANEFSGRFSDLIAGDRRVTREEFVSALQESIQNLTDDYSNQVRDEFQSLRSRGELPVDLTEDQVKSLFDGSLEDEDLINALEDDTTVQEAIARRGYRTALGQSIAKSTTQERSMFFDANSPFNSGATGAFRSFTNGFVQGDKDFFGSRVLYDNVFGQYEDGGESLTMLHRRSISDPTNDMNRTAGAKIMDDVVNRSIYDQTEIIDRVDTEFSRFHGESMVDQLSMTGAGLQSARQTIRRVLAEGSAVGRQMADRGEQAHPMDFATAMIARLNEDATNEVGEVVNALSLLDNNLKNRSGQSAGADGGYVNKAGIAQFVDLINTAGSRDSSGNITGGHIAISSFQFQNEAISAALSDKIQRQVLESVLQRRTGGGGGPLKVDLVLAYPRQRNLNDRNNDETRFGVGSTNYGILGPNLIEAMKLEEVKNDVYDMLRGLGVAEAELDSYLQVNIQFRDKKFHPKVYLTDNVAGIGTQNLTGPVGNSINQAGSNFETMRFVANKYDDAAQLQRERSQYTAPGRQQQREHRDNTVKTDDITQSLLYRQISEAVQYEQNYDPTGKLNRAGGGTSAPIINNRRGQQVGFAGDIYQHLRNTLDYAYSSNFNIVNGSQPNTIRKEVAGQNTTHMFMVIDQAFMLQLGSGATEKLLKGEMGEEIGTPFAERGSAHRQYREQQSKLFDLLIANKASVVVDAKNFNSQVRDPIKEKIANSNDARLQENYKRAGQSLGLLAGYELFDPGAASTPEDYNAAMKSMRRQLKRQGFTEENGFTEEDIKQLIGLASGNVEMAKAPRQHVKSFGLMDYRQGGSPELISYYMGSSNLGLYSLGIPTGPNNGYTSTDGNLTNTEMGIMLGNRDIDSQLSRATAHKARMVGEGNPADINGILPPITSSLEDWTLNQEEERHELMLAQRHLIHTWNTLSTNSITNPSFQSVNTAPLWQNNINQGDLVVLKDRLETMAREFGIDPHASRSAFQVVERYGGTSASGLTSINVSIDIAQMLGSSGNLRATAKMPKLNFELTVLQGPSRGSGMLQDRTDGGGAPGFVYFVDKNRVVGNGIFSNDSGKDLQVLGRNNYEDDFISSMKDGGRITLKSGESAHMSSLDIVPQLFATLIGEGISRFGTEQAHKRFTKITNPTQALEEYIATALTGKGSQFDEGEGYLQQLSSGRRVDDQGNLTSNYVRSARDQIKANLTNVSMHAMLEQIERDAFALEQAADADFSNSRSNAAERARRQTLRKNLEQFKEYVQQTVNRDILDNKQVSDTTINTVLNMVNMLARQSPQMANVIMKTGSLEDDEAEKIKKFKDFQSLMFGSFLQSREERTYGGQQGFYRTILMGVGDSAVDQRTANLMFDLDDTPGLHNVAGYARFKPLEYKPTTDIHEIMYRSVASKSTSMSKNDADLDSLLLETEARDLGDAANLRLMSSIGVGTILDRDNYIIRDDQGNIEVGRDQREVFEAMEAAGVDEAALEVARNAYLKAVQDTKKGGFSFDSDGRRDRTRLQFYTGPTGKLSQLPQRIKNAMGARPMYQYSFEARQALEQGFAIQDITKSYLERHREPIRKITRKEVDRLEDERDRLVATLGEDHEQVKALDRRINNLIRIGSQAFNDSISGLGAVFSGRIKSVLNAEQSAYIENIKSLLEEALGDTELEEEEIQEILRIEVMKAGLVNKGLGKMIAGSDNMKYSLSIIQLSGTYNDTFLANPLYGTTYGSKADYQAIQKNQLDVETMTPQQLKEAGVLNVGMREGYLETQQKSIKGSMMGEGGMNVLLQAGDKIVEDKQTGMFVQRRKVNGVWVTVNVVDDKRNLATIGNIIDNTSFSNVGSPTLGSQPTTTYGRRGEDSIDYIYEVESRPGNFQNNEYLLDFKRLRSIRASSGRRVEGTDSASLVKGVAFFAGRTKYETPNGEVFLRNPFEEIERQIMSHYTRDRNSEVGGALGALLDYADETQTFETAGGRKVYTPLSSMIQGVFNSNNFKSFFWSHGATILRAQSEGVVGEKGDHFMLKKLFDTHQDVNVQNAKKLAGALMLTFGTDFISSSQGDQAGLSGQKGKLKQTLVSAMMAGEYGGYYQQLALATAVNMKVEDIRSFQEKMLSNGRNVAGMSMAEISSELLFNKISKKAGYNAMNAGAIGGITSELLGSVFEGNEGSAAKLLQMFYRKGDDGSLQGILAPSAIRASNIGGINFDNSADRQSALLVTAVDFMHQLSRKSSQLTMPSDIDMSSQKMQEVLLTAVGMGGFEDDEFKEDILAMISGLNTQINAVSVFTDITFSFSKDPTGTQTVGKHEAHHLITPYLGNIKKYQEGGQLDKIQHTVAALAAITQGVRHGKHGMSGIAYYDRLARSGFTEKSALNLASSETDYLFTSFHKEKFLGFYQFASTGVASADYVGEYKNINKDLVRGSYSWGGFQTIRNVNDPSQINYFAANGQRVNDLAVMGDAQKQVDRFIDKFYPGIEPNERRRLQDKFLAMGGQEFALYQLEALTAGMANVNAAFQADPRKSMGKDTTSQFLQRMQNKQMFITIPAIDFKQQNGEIVARTDRQNLVSTILPSADDMRVMGAQYADFVDPILGHYKNIASIFVPGTQENEVFEKIRLATQSGVPIVLSTTEFQVYKRIQDSAKAMPTELQKGIAGARFQEAMAGKNKYQGFTSTGIGSMLMPFGMAALAQTKLDEAGMRENKARIEAIKETDRTIRQLKEKLQPSYTEKERAFIDMDLLDRGKSAHVEMLKVQAAAKSFNEKQKVAFNRLNYSLKQLQKHRKQGFAAERESLTGSAKAQNMAALLDHFDSTYDQLDILYNSELENESIKQSIAKLRSDVEDHRLRLTQQAEALFGLKSYRATDVMHIVDGNKALYDSKDERYEIVRGQKAARLSVYGVARRGETNIESVGMIVGENAIPLIGLSTNPRHPVNSRKGYIYTDEETGEDEVVQRAIFRAAYMAKKTELPDFSIPVNKATARPGFKSPTNQLTLIGFTKLTEEQDRITAEINEKYGFTPTPSNTQRYGMAFDSGEQFGPPLPSPTRDYVLLPPIKLYGPPEPYSILSKSPQADPDDIREDLSVDNKNPVAWQKVRQERRRNLQEVRRIILTAKNAKQLSAMADIIKSRLDTAVPELQTAYRQMLERDIPNTFNRLEGDPWLTTITTEPEDPSNTTKQKVNKDRKRKVIENPTRAKDVVSNNWVRRFDVSQEAIDERNDPLRRNIQEFQRKQRAALAFGIQSALRTEYEGMKRDSLEAKREIAKFSKAEFPTVEEKKKAFNDLKAAILKKRNEAYRMAGMDPETGRSIYDQKSGGKKEKASIDGYPVNKPSLQDSYIYHAQALNYEGMLTYVMQLGNEADLEPLSEDRVKEMQRKRKNLAEVRYVLNTTEGAHGSNIFEGLGNYDAKINVDALFMTEQIDPEAGFVQTHMKTIKTLTKDARKIGGKRVASTIGGKYAIEQIEAQIKMYEARAEEMQKFSRERESVSLNADTGKFDEGAMERINTATKEYSENTQRIIDFLKSKRDAIQNSMANGNIDDTIIRHTFEDIDTEVAITESRYVEMAEVFRSPPPGNTDPRMMTYRAMQGIQALNQLSSLLQKTGRTSKDITQQGSKMIYSTERGQTATVMAALGIVTYGGGDWDGDSYTAIFDQANDIKSEIQKQQGKVTQHQLLMKSHERRISTLKARAARIDTSTSKGRKRHQRIMDQISKQEALRANSKTAVINASSGLQDAKQRLEESIRVGYRGMNARARAQISAYTGIDERYFVQEGDLMYDAQGNVIQDEAGNNVTGLRRGKTMDADAMFVYMEQGYGLIEGIDSKRNEWLTMMNNIDIITGYRKNTKAFDDDGFLRQVVSGIQKDDTGKISAQSPGITMLRERVNEILTNNSNLTQQQIAFLSTIRDGGDDVTRSLLTQFQDFLKDLERSEASQRQLGTLESDAVKLAQQRRAHMNEFIGHRLISGIQSNATLGKFMQQGMGMTLTEGTFDMTLKTLGKAGGEILGKTYNTIVGSTYQDAPILTVGRELQKKDSDLRKSLQAEFIKQQHKRRATEPPSDEEMDLRREAAQQGLTGADADEFIVKRLDSKYAADFEKDFLGTVNKAVGASEDVQGFMKNIHQLLRDSIKLKGDADDLIPELQKSSEKYEQYSQQIASTDDEDKRKELLKERNKIIEGMASQLGPGPGLKSLIDLDYLTNESDRGGLTKSEFEERFFDGTIEGNRDNLERMAASMMETGALTMEDMHELRGITKGHTEESAALMKMARAQTARNLIGLVTSYRMERVEGGGNRGQSIREFAASHRARLATQIQAHEARDVPSNLTSDANIRSAQEYEAGQRIKDRYDNVIAKEHEGARFDAHRQHKEALASHLGMEVSQVYEEDGITLTKEYQDKLKGRADSLQVTVEEYTLMFDMQYEEGLKTVGNAFGEDGKKMENFTVMNMFRKDVSRAMMDGRAPSAGKQEVINQSIGSEVMTTLAQAAAAGKLDAEGMDMFTAMNKGVIRHLVEATNQEITYFDKKQGKHVTKQFSQLNKQGQNAVITQIVHQNMFGTPDDGSPMGYHRSTSEEAKTMRQQLGAMVGSSELELREDGTFGNDILDALDKTTTGSSTKAQIEMYEALGEEYLRETLDSKEMQDQLYKKYLKADGINPNSEEARTYRSHLTATIQHQIKTRQEKIAETYGYSRKRHNRGYGVQNRTSFMNNLNSKVVGQLAKDSRANALDLVAPLILTAAGTAMSEGNISGDQVMALGGAAVTAFQYARTGAIDFSDMDPIEAKSRMAAVQASSGIFKLKNAMANNDGDFGKAIAQTVIQETASIAFNAIAAPWLSRNIAERALGAGAAPAMDALDMTRYKAGQQLAGNIGASLISAVSSTVISGLIMNTMQDNKPGLSETISGFMPAAQAVSQVNEAIARRRQQEAAMEDFVAETDGTDNTIQEYQVLTDATYDPNDFASIADLAAAQEIEPGSDGSLSVGIIG